MKHLDKILNSKKTVWTYQDVSLVLGMTNRDTIKSFFARWINDGIFVNLQKWIYALKNYNIYEFATKVKKKSYISLETVLKQQWIIFQDYAHTIFLVSDNTWSKTSKDYTFKYSKIQDSILVNPLWLINTWSYTIASPERAICDRLYLSSDYYFDDIEHVDVQLLQEISMIYNQRVIYSIQKLIQHAQSR